MRTFTLLFCLFLTTFGALLPQAYAGSQLHFVSDPGEYIGQGKEVNLTSDNGYLITVSGDVQSGLNFSITSSDNSYSTWWYLSIAAPQGQTLQVADYDDAEREPFRSGTHPGLDLSGNGAGSNTLTGNFQVHELVTDANGKIIRFAADFEQHSEGGPRALYGEIRYNSDLPLPMWAPVVSMTSSTPYLYAGSGYKATLTFTRTVGSRVRALRVHYVTGGTAVSGRDYQAIEKSVLIKAGQASATLEVTPIDSAVVQQRTVNLNLRLQPRDSYIISDVGNKTRISITSANN